MWYVVWRLVIVVTVVSGHSARDNLAYDLFDGCLSRMEASLQEEGSEFVRLPLTVVEGYVLEGARLGDLTQLRRHGNVTISSTGTGVTLSGYVELPNMVVRGGNITSLDATIINPVVTFNGFDGFWFTFWSNAKQDECMNSITIERSYWTRGTVLLTSDSEEFANVDITKFILLNEEVISEPLEEALSEAFLNHFSFCDSIKNIYKS